MGIFGWKPRKVQHDAAVVVKRMRQISEISNIMPASHNHDALLPQGFALLLVGALMAAAN